MRKMYQSTDKLRRAQEARKNAEECDKAGFPCIGKINWQIAEILDPIVDTEYDF